jgi:DNA-directed RNA polymerase subunit RPC12/RpoP
MADWKCPDCGANMTLIDNYDDTGFLRCPYCGKNIPVRITRPALAQDPYLSPYIQELRRQIAQAEGKKKEKLEKKLAREIAYQMNVNRRD